MKRTVYVILAALIVLGVQTFSPLAGESAAAQRESPLAGATALIEVTGLGSAYVVGIKGIGSENEVVEYRTAQAKGDTMIQKIPGKFKFSDIVIKINVPPLQNDFLYQWRKSFMLGVPKDFRRNGSISFLDATMKPVARYNFFNAWPSQWKGITLDLQSPQALTEEFVLTVERIERVQ